MHLALKKSSTTSYLSSIRFPLVNLGRIAPKIGGVKVHSGSTMHRNEIIIDVNVQYAGDLRIDVEAEMAGVAGKLMPTAKASIQNVAFKGAMR
jgi:hypothetical protein